MEEWEQSRNKYAVVAIVDSISGEVLLVWGCFLRSGNGRQILRGQRAISAAHREIDTARLQLYNRIGDIALL